MPNSKRKLPIVLKYKSGGGFTLIEMLITVTIFVSLVTIISTIFVSALRAQRQGLAYQQLLDQTSYLMEYMSRAIRMAIKDDIESKGETLNCLLTGNKVNYEYDGQCLKFRSYDNKCQSFCWDGKRLKEIKDGVLSGYLTSPDLTVSSFNVSLSGQAQDDDFQPLVTISLEIKGKEQSKIKIKTSVSQRNLDVELD